MDSHTSCLNLPSSLFDVYLRYKQGTRAIVAWLTSCTATPQIRETYTIKDLQYLANIVRTKRECLPDLVAFHFRETIRSREKLSQYFRKNSCDTSSDSDSDTLNHEFFTERLREIYASLCCASDRSGNMVLRCYHDHEEAQNHSSAKCAYDVLEVAPCDDAVYNMNDGVQQDEGERTSISSAETKTANVPDLADDRLSERLENLKFLKELDEAFSMVRRSWQRAARNEIPLVLAAFTTSAAFASLKNCQDRFMFLQNTLVTNCASNNQTQVQGTQPCDGVAIKRLFAMRSPKSAERIYETYSSLPRLKQNSSNICTVPDNKACEKPSEYISMTWNPDSEQEERCVIRLFEAIRTVACSGLHSDVVRLGTPLTHDISSSMNSKGNESDAFDLKGSIGIQLLIHGFESFTWTEPGNPMTNTVPRLQALRFAREVRDSVEAVLAHQSMPCRCCLTLASNLEIFQKDLDSFLRERNFDLLFQSPWVSGSHMLEILETSFYYAMRLCSYKHLFGSLLHIYNCLVEVGQMETIPFLEILCKVFENTVFQAGRPKSGFRVSFLRLKGGRLKQSRSDRKHWNLAVPQYSAREAAGFGLPRQPVDSKFRYEKTSLLHLIKSNGYQMDKFAWQSFSARFKEHCCTPKTPETNPHHERKLITSSNVNANIVSPIAADDRCYTGQSCLLEVQNVLLNSELMQSKSNPLPNGTINYFKLYLLVARTMYTINNHVHDKEPSGGYCMCFVDNLLCRGDAWIDGALKISGESFGCNEMVKACKTAILKEFNLQREEWNEYLWKHI